MKPFTPLKIGLAVVVLLVASLSTARARQIWDGNQAHSSYTSARNDAMAALQKASAAGLTAAELAPYRSRADGLTGRKAPTASPLWDPSTADFYNRQAKGYQALALAIDRQVRHVTRATLRQAVRSLTALKRDIATARRLDVDSTAAAGALANGRAALGRNSLPKQFRSITSSARQSYRALRAAVWQQARNVSAVLSQAHNDRNAIFAQAQQEASQADGQLSLLSLLTPRADSYRRALSTELQAVQSAPLAFAAAVKETHIHRELATIAADYYRTLPHKMIVVSTESQSASMYQDGRQIYSTLVTTGGPELPTDHGVFHIYMKVTPWVFHSPWPPGSPYYYPPTPITYWMPFDGGEGLHDAWWRSNFGPGSNLQPTYLGTGNYILGTHGCVNLPMDAAQFVWDWAPVGTTVVVI